MTESFRNQDMRAEQVLAQFMDEYFYSHLRTKEGVPVIYTRIEDRDSQISGVDVCIKVGDREILIDEKAALYYSNAMIPTFVFELDSIQKGHTKPVEGWFINDELKTEYYMLIWPNVKCYRSDIGKQWIRKDLDTLHKDDFTIVEAMLVKKSNLRNALEKQGYGRSHLIEYAKRFRNMYEKSNQKEEEQLIDNIKISLSGQLAEKPVNLVIRKELLKGLAKAIYLISADGYAKIKG